MNRAIRLPQTLESKGLSPKANCSLFKIQTGNQWMNQAKARPHPKMLFDEFIFENEVCILFADTNLGKSILAVQIANSISRGKPIYGFRSNITSQKVLYFDFELSDKQFELRYSEDCTNHYHWHENFIRAEIDSDAEIGEIDFETYLYLSIEKALNEFDAKVVIIDNLTFLKDETEKSKNALPLMKKLKSLKNKYGLSILILAHTPKRDLSKKITRNDLAGSKMLINFCDSAFAIGECNSDSGLRYLKQIKVRNAAIKYDSDNVIKCEIEKDVNFLQFSFLGYANENEFFKSTNDDEKESELDMIESLLEQGFTQRDIANDIKKSLGYVNKQVKKLREQKL